VLRIPLASFIWQLSAVMGSLQATRTSGTCPALVRTRTTTSSLLPRLSLESSHPPLTEIKSTISLNNMVSTRRTNAAANAEPAQARTTRATRKAAASQPASGEAEVVASTTTRRLRSKQTASPLKSLGEPKRIAPKPSAAKATVARATTTTTKRKRGASRASAEPESAKDDEEGLFFRSGRPQFFLTPVPTPLTMDSSSADMEYVSVEAPLSPPWEPTWERLAREKEEEIVQVILSSASPEVIIIALRKDISKLRAQVTGLQHLEVQNQDLLAQNRDLSLSNTHLRTLLEMLRTGQVQANSPQLDIDSFGIPAEPPSPAQPEFFHGDEAALALLRKIEAAARAPPIAPPDEDREAEAQSLPPQPVQEVTQSESSQGPADATPSRSISEPSGFFSRSFSAIKTRLGFTPTPTASTPTTPSSRTPPPGSFTEVLSTPPTPVGERSKARPRKKKTSPMLRLLLKGVEASDMSKAEAWAKHAIPAFMNLSNYETKRRLLETPVLVQDLEHFPSCKPWESGFGDPLGDLDDEELVPVWAVYLQIIAQEEEPQKKKSKSSHGATMEVDFAQSLDEMSAAAIGELQKGAQSPRPKLHNSHGNSASHLDLEPRRSVQPSPMFGSSSSSHQEGVNVFNELQGHDTTVELQTNDRDSLLEATKNVTRKVTNHNPSEGSYGLDYGSDDDDSSLLSETSDADAGSSLWTQPPPPAPVPAHAPLPGGSAAETSSVPTSQDPVDEVARQRQKLMKHTPAKPSRLREAFVPSPSVRSDAGNESLFLATPLAAPGTFDDMPGAEDLGLTSEEWAEVDEIRKSEAFLADDASAQWPDAILTYSSDEEDVSPI
jgi:hypothetical protein